MAEWTTRSTTAALCALALWAAACSEATAPAQKTANKSPAQPAAQAAVKGYDCAALLSPQDVERIVGRGGARMVSSVRGDANPQQPGHTECGYFVPPAGGLHFYINTGPALDPNNGYDLRGSAERNQAERLAGIGDEAWLWQLKGNSFSAFAVAKGAETFASVGNEGGQGKAIVQRVLATVVSKL